MRGVICLVVLAAGCLTAPEPPPQVATTPAPSNPAPPPAETPASAPSDGGVADAGVADGGASPTGGLTPEQIRRVVMADVGGFQACYEVELKKDPELKGGLHVAFTIDRDGSVVDVHADYSSLGKPIEDCMVARFRKLRFPSAEKRTNAVFPFVFKGKR